MAAAGQIVGRSWGAFQAALPGFGESADFGPARCGRSLRVQA